MRKTAALFLLVLCLLLSGCTSWLDGSYSSVNPHMERDQEGDDQTLAVSTYQELRTALIDLVESGAESALINVAQMNPDSVIRNMDRAVAYVTNTNPIGAYAVKEIEYEHGTSGGQSAMSVTVTYNHNRNEINKIKQASGMTQTGEIIAAGLQTFEPRIVIRVKQYRDTDLVQLVADYADENPDVVMELPQITVNMYPESGEDRLLELVFTYQSSRESLRSMQSRVHPLFTSAELYVAGNDSEHEKYSQLYSFLMERNQYTVETSITPTYSLLVHGVGDSKAFAVVYAAMCRRAGLECMVISGSREGDPLFWNLICDDGIYYHIDLLRCSEEEAFLRRTDADMEGYVWDYSAYPASTAPEPDPTDPTDPTEPEEPIDPTEPEEPTRPVPTQPDPTDPPPTEPVPTDPPVTEPVPTEPEPTEPDPTEPEPSDPEPTEPEPTDPTEPNPTEPDPTEDTQPTEPDPTEPTESTDPTEPEHTEPTVQSDPTEPDPTEPTGDTDPTEQEHPSVP